MAKKVRKIPATLNQFTSEPVAVRRKKKVAGYTRVSTDREEQATSYEAQMTYYKTYIEGHEDWEFVGMYSDEGITGTSIKRRDGFNKMIEDALAGKIDLIVTKSVSRFARNTVDSLTTVRKLKDKGGWKFTLRRRTFSHWTSKANCLSPSCPALHRKKAVPSVRTPPGGSESDLRTAS